VEDVDRGKLDGFGCGRRELLSAEVLKCPPPAVAEVMLARLCEKFVIVSP